MNAKDIFSSIRQVHRSTRISKGARREIAVDSDNSCVHQKQTTALLYKNLVLSTELIM